jgi:hypothetical protein
LILSSKLVVYWIYLSILMWVMIRIMLKIFRVWTNVQLNVQAKAKYHQCVITNMRSKQATSHVDIGYLVIGPFLLDLRHKFQLFFIAKL